jgi:hypothetical protein
VQLPSVLTGEGDATLFNGWTLTDPNVEKARAMIDLK